VPLVLPMKPVIQAGSSAVSCGRQRGRKNTRCVCAWAQSEPTMGAGAAAATSSAIECSIIP
jgi:hypothetical protein